MQPLFHGIVVQHSENNIWKVSQLVGKGFSAQTSIDRIWHHCHLLLYRDRVLACLLALQNTIASVMPEICSITQRRSDHHTMLWAQAPSGSSSFNLCRLLQLCSNGGQFNRSALEHYVCLAYSDQICTSTVRARETVTELKSRASSLPGEKIHLRGCGPRIPVYPWVHLSFSVSLLVT